MRVSGALPGVVHRRRRHDVYIGRPTKWGNPFEIGRDGDRAEVIEKHRIWFLRQPDLIADAQRELVGKVLGCWCAPLGCHGNIIHVVANMLGVPSRVAHCMKCRHDTRDRDRPGVPVGTRVCGPCLVDSRRKETPK